MLNLELPTLDPAAPRPEFLDATSCKQWLKDRPLTNIQSVQEELREQLGLLSHYPLPALERLKILEQLRETVAFVAGELGRKYHARPLPFATLEQIAWRNAETLWQSLGANYLLCLQANTDGDPGVAPFSALIAQRALRCIVMRMLEYGQAFRPFPAHLWHALHTLYLHAEQSGVASKRIKDSLNREDGSDSSESSYARALLLSLADPQRMSARQLIQLDRWLDKWTARTPVSKEQPPTPKLPLVAIDLAGEGGPVIYADQPMQNKRFLDTERIAMSLRKRIKFLRAGGNPAETGLGEECIQPGCEALLSALHQRWCEAPLNRAHDRSSSETPVQLCFALPAIYFFLNDDTPFKQPGETFDVPREILDDMRLYGRVTQRTEKLLLSRLGFTLENWRCLDRGAGGFRLERGSEGERINQNQLLAQRVEGDKDFALAVVRWLAAQEDGGICIGTRTLPGTPSVLAARPIALNQLNAGPFVPAFRLAAVPEQKEPETLVLPVGWYQPGRLIHIYGSLMEEAKLMSLLEKGANFERVTFLSKPVY